MHALSRKCVRMKYFLISSFLFQCFAELYIIRLDCTFRCLTTPESDAAEIPHNMLYLIHEHKKKTEQ